MEVVEHEQIERVRLIIDEVRPVIPEPREVDRPDEVAPDGLPSSRELMALLPSGGKREAGDVPSRSR